MRRPKRKIKKILQNPKISLDKIKNIVYNTDNMMTGRKQLHELEPSKTAVVTSDSGSDNNKLDLACRLATPIQVCVQLFGKVKTGGRQYFLIGE